MLWPSGSLTAFVWVCDARVTKFHGISIRCRAGTSVIKVYLPSKGARPQQRRVPVPRERPAAAASGLIPLMNTTQSEVDVLWKRVGLLDSLQGFLEEEMDEDVALDVLDVPAL